MPTIVNTTQNSRTLPDGKTVLLAGANEVSSEAWAASQCDHLSELLKRGILREQPAIKPVENFQVGSVPAILAALTPRAALAAIDACEDPAQLEAWLQTDGRSKVREALTKRAYALAPAADGPPDLSGGGEAI